MLPIKKKCDGYDTKVKFLRTERQLSQWELASASGVPRWAIQLIETGIRMPEPHQVQALAGALGSTIEHVFPELAARSAADRAAGEGARPGSTSKQNAGGTPEFKSSC